MVWKLADGGWLGADGRRFGSAEEAHRSLAKVFGWPKPKLAPEQLAPARRLRVFLCHAKEDKPAVRDIHRALSEAGVEPWLDEFNLVPGQKWKAEIRQAISGSDAFVACLSPGGLTREGFLHREIREALERAMEMPEGRIFLIPVRLQPCNVPEPLNEYHWVNYYSKNGPGYLVQALAALAHHLNKAGASVKVPKRLPVD